MVMDGTMSDIKVNKVTGQIAVPVEGGFKVYEKGQYKQNSVTGEYAVPTADGKWQVFAGPESSSPQADTAGMKSIPIPYDMAAPGATNIDYSAESSPIETFLRATGKGAMLGFGDEIGGAVKGYVPALFNGKDPQAEYARVRDQFRGQDARESAVNPKAAFSGNVTGQVATGAGVTLATGGTSLPAMLGLGAAQGGATGLGESEATNAGDMATDTLKGAAWGTGGALVGYAGGKLIEKLVNQGIAYATIQKAVDGNTDDLLREMSAKGISAAEADDVLKEVVRGQASRNPTAANAVIPAAQARMGEVGAQTIDDVNRLVSPENAQQYITQLQQQARNVAGPGYQAAYANPARVGLVPEITNNPAMADALKAAEKLAAAQGRTFNATDLGVQDLDALQRALATSSKRMFESTPENTLLGPVYDDLSTGINKMAGSMSPELAQTQAQYATIKAAEDAVELGKKALDPSKEFVQVADEFTNLSPEAQKGYLAGMATKLRTMLQQKSSTANPGTAFNKEAVIEKLKAVGFPEDQVDAIIKRGASARGVLDALVGGSDTAKKLGAMDASRSALSKFADRASGDITMAGITGQPGLLAMIPGLRALGGAQDRAVSKGLLDMLTEQSGRGIRGLLDYAPQTTTTPLLNILGRGAGGYQAGR